MPKKISPHANIMARWPTAAALADDVGQPYDRVRQWRITKNGIPVRYWPAVIAAAKRRKIAISTAELADAVGRD